jgi:hypothetical protein
MFDYNRITDAKTRQFILDQTDRIKQLVKPTADNIIDEYVSLLPQWVTTEPHEPMIQLQRMEKTNDRSNC